MRAPADVDRNLLFGLLALQTGLIDRPALSLALRIWCADKSRELAQILADQGALPVSRRLVLEALLGEHIEAHDSDPTRSLASIVPSPSTVEDLRSIGDVDLDATLDVIGAATLEYPPRGSSQDHSAGSSTRDSKRFRILRPHRKGGIGLVSVALDLELNREVALKQILDRHADDPYSRSRFLQEAEITGGLEHPGIVPVYSLGNFNDGRPYYAMRFIKGDTLKDAVAEHYPREDGGLSSHPGRSRELEFRKLLRRFIDVCNAIEYAHGRGVLHRDLKPSNVMVGKYGETLVVDWGLAKAVGKPDLVSPDGECALFPSHGSGEIETVPGSAIGTPAYMSPEQAHGQLDRIGPRSDVYSLGATLYTILTGHPPYEGPDQRAILEAVRLGRLNPPRERNPAIDPSLEAVCLKAMAREPEHRYCSAAALAEDVDRWMADEPVSAYQDAVVRRLARWGRKNSPVVTGSVVFLVAAVVGLSVVAGLIARHSTRLEAARLEAKSAGGMAHKAVRAMLSDVAGNDLLNIPKGELLRVKLTERALGLYRDFAKAHPADTDFELEHARIEEQVASLYRMIGKYDMARPQYEAAIARLNRVIGSASDSTPALDYLAYTEGQFAQMIEQAGGTSAEAEPHYLESIRIAERLRAMSPDEPKYARRLAATASDLGVKLIIAGRFADAKEQLDRAAAAAGDFQGSLPSWPDPKKYEPQRLVLPMIQINLADVLKKLGRDQEAEEVAKLAVGSLRDLSRAYPDNPDLKYLLANALQEISGIKAVDQDRIEEALGDLDQAVALVTPLLTQFDKVVTFPRYLARLRADRGSLHLRAGQLASARDDLAFADAKLEERVNLEKSSAEPLRELGKVKASLSRLADKAGDRRLARTLAAEAVGFQQKAMAIEPGRRLDQEQLNQHQTLHRELAEPRP